MQASVFLLILGIFVGQSTRSAKALICYDNIFNDRLVQIGCDFPEAACAVTKMTTRKTYFGSAIKSTEMLYHCAKRSTSCIYGPMKRCTADNNTKCNTKCCDSDECNAPKNATLSDIPKVDQISFKECYQFIGHDLEKVKCFKNATCLGYDVKPIFASFENTYDVNLARFCALESTCGSWKSACSAYKKYNVLKTCTTTCCKGTLCNNYDHSRIKLTNTAYPPLDEKKFKHRWTGPRNFLSTTTTTEKLPTTKFMRKVTVKKSYPRLIAISKSYTEGNNGNRFSRKFPIPVIFVAVALTVIIAGSWGGYYVSKKKKRRHIVKRSITAPPDYTRACRM